MTRIRWTLLTSMLILSLTVAYFLRDVGYYVFIVPLAYLFWLLKYYYTAIPQVFLWFVLIVLLLIIGAANFIPEARSSRNKGHFPRPSEGQIETLALWIRKSRQGNYFKWQLANRLGQIIRQMNGLLGLRESSKFSRKDLENYFDAGLNNSFVDYPTPRNPFQHPLPTPLDLDPKDAVDYLESQMEQRRE